MTDYEPTTEELTDRTDRYNRLGTDARGREHYATMQLGPASHGVAWAVAGDEIVASTVIDDVADWVAHVAETAGWRECRYSDVPVDEWLAARLAEVA